MRELDGKPLAFYSDTGSIGEGTSASANLNNRGS
jgi:hypothetical protein